MVTNGTLLGALGGVEIVLNQSSINAVYALLESHKHISLAATYLYIIMLFHCNNTTMTLLLSYQM